MNDLFMNDLFIILQSCAQVTDIWPIRCEDFLTNSDEEVVLKGAVNCYLVGLSQIIKGLHHDVRKA